MRNTTINQNDDASSSKSFKTSDNSVQPSWSDVDQDLLFTIMMKLELLDFFAFSKVCKSWRSLALAHINKYMGSRQPMSVTGTEKEWYFEDLEGRKIKIIIPHFTGVRFVGLTCGYLIFVRGIAFWLVNPFTSHELYLPCYSYDAVTDLSDFRGILVFSPTVSQWVFVFSHRFSNKISFSLSGNQASYSDLTSDSIIIDIHFFKGKIYALTRESHLFEVRLDPKPTLTRLEMKNSPDRSLLWSVFVNSDKNLYSYTRDGYELYEIDLENMEWVLTEKAKVEHAFFVGYLKSTAAINPDIWDDRRIQYERFVHFKVLDRSEIKGCYLMADMWYFPHDLFNVNTLQLQ